MYFILIDGAYILMPETFGFLCADTDDGACELSEAVEFLVEQDGVGLSSTSPVTVEYRGPTIPDGKFYSMSPRGAEYIIKATE